MKSNRVLILVFGLTALAATAADLKIALLAPMSGPVPSYGISMRDGALLAIKEWNARGGVLGRRIIPILEDSQCAAGPAVAAAKKVITSDGVHYILGEVCSSASIPVSDIANAAKVIEVTPTSTHPSVTVDESGRTKAFIFRACFIDPFQGRIGADFAYKNLKARKAFIMADETNGYVSGLAEAFQATFEALGGVTVGRQAYIGANSNFSDILEKVQVAQPDIVYLPDYYPVVNTVTRQAREMGILVPFMGGDGWDSADLDKASVAAGYFTTHFSSGDPRLAVSSFIKAFGAEYKDGDKNPQIPDAIAVLGYDAANLLLTAIKAAGADDTVRVSAALEKASFPGVAGRIVFDSHHDPVKPAVVLKVTPAAVEFATVVAP